MRKLAAQLLRGWRPLQASSAGIVTRTSLAARYLRGAGLEIGALHAPLPLPPGAKVAYVDRISRAESLRVFPELDPATIVEPDYLIDGFRLAEIADGTQDFVIANHVLEHTPNPVDALLNWHRVLRPGGIMFAGVPLVDRTFDCGRAVTEPQHMLDDHRLTRAGATVEMAERDLDHYIDWVTVSLRGIARRNGTTLPDWDAWEIDRIAREKQGRHEEIHFHTFSQSSCKCFLTTVAESLLPDCEVCELHECGGYEVVAILRRNS